MTASDRCWSLALKCCEQVFGVDEFLIHVVDLRLKDLCLTLGHESWIVRASSMLRVLLIDWLVSRTKYCEHVLVVGHSA